MDAPLLLLSLSLLAAAPTLEDARQAAAEARLDGAAMLVQSALEQESDEPRRKALIAYQEALAELKRQALLTHDVYAVGGTAAIAPLLESMKESTRLKDFPELGAHAFRMERWANDVARLRAEAASALDAGDYDKAHEIYERLTKHPLVQARTRDLQDDITKGLREASPPFSTRAGNSLGRWLTTAWGWEPLRYTLLTLAFFTLAYLFLWPLRRLRKWHASRSKYTELVLYDGTHPSVPGPSDSLAASLKAVCFEVARQPRTTRAVLDAGVGEALAWTDAHPLQALESFAQHLSGQITVGPVSLPAKVLWTFFGHLTTGARYRMEGVVTRDHATTRVTLSRKDLVDPRPSESWAVTSAGTDAPALYQAFRKLAYMLAFTVLPHPPTQNVDAFLAYREALETLSQATSPEALKKGLTVARDGLQRALGLDPSMRPAILLLAIVQRKLGATEKSRALLAELKGSKDALEQAELQYHKALLDLQCGEENQLQSAFDALEKVAQRKDKLGVDAKASMLDLCTSLHLSERSRKATKSTAGVRMEKIEALQKEFEEFFLQDQQVEGVTPVDYQHARGYALYSVGRRHLELGGRRHGIRLLERGIIYVPDLLAAHVKLARAYRDLKDDGWSTAAERVLSHAQLIDADDPELNEELGHFHAALPAPEHEKAASCYRRAAPHLHSAGLALGKLLGGPLKKPEEGIRQLWLAIALAGDVVPPYYGEAIHNCAVTAAHQLREQAEKDAWEAGKALSTLADPATQLMEQAHKAKGWLAEQMTRHSGHLAALGKQTSGQGTAADSPEEAIAKKCVAQANKYLLKCDERMKNLRSWPPPTNAPQPPTP
ncbi:hypothetical protein MYSTI_02567 [Myxococcus stipitatus DSM 14675]|uniref:TPR repeat-containing protein n=1 Tax=Myxococcus stipitatus (strain DSM 14675 / JCM 12634 / Mx s8) TaxID=1278073 RepID=L7U710_MYXSD|nr:hypothetical protein [Myxococcus stipitatus]AGC43883.1 hypothetical protein MYSTI_02567 [Myxococcus stipitatus DSM 14675]